MCRVYCIVLVFSFVHVVHVYYVSPLVCVMFVAEWLMLDVF